MIEENIITKKIKKKQQQEEKKEDQIIQFNRHKVQGNSTIPPIRTSGNT